MQDLKPCPFCGSKAMIVGGGNSSRGRVPAHVECASRLCMATTKEAGDSEKAAAIWNARAEPANAELCGERSESERAPGYASVPNTEE